MGPGLIESVSGGMIRPSHVSSQPPIPPERGRGGGRVLVPKFGISCEFGLKGTNTQRSGHMGQKKCQT